MESINNNDVPSSATTKTITPKTTTPNTTATLENNNDDQNQVFAEISKILSRWNGLQMAVENRWGGHDSLQKSQQLADDIFSWFSKSNVSLDAEDVESLLHENMLLTFNTDIEDGSIEEVAEQLMILHDEYLHKEVN